MQPRDTATRKRRDGNGRSKAENHIYASLAANSKTREQQLESIAHARAGRRAKATERVLARQPHLTGDELQREVDRELARAMQKARAAALTARRQARQAAAARAALEETDLDASGLLDAGSDGTDSDDD